MKKEIQTSGPVAKTDFFSLPHIGEGKISDMNAVLRDTRANKITLMRGIFNDLTGKKLQIIEQDKNSHNESNVILRDANGRAIDRL